MKAGAYLCCGLRAELEHDWTWTARIVLPAGRNRKLTLRAKAQDPRTAKRNLRSMVLALKRALA